MADSKIQYSLWCETCGKTVRTAFLDYSAPLPTVCPVNPAHTNISNVAVCQVLNPNAWEIKENGVATTQETTPQTATSIVVPIEAGGVYRLKWYCEFKMSSNSTAYARVGHQGAQSSGVTGDHWNSDSEYIPFSGCDEFTAQYTEDVTIAIQFWISSASKIASIRRRRLFVERINIGE